nr:hypothetical protein [Tanacetum cinerariifolium]
METQNPLLKDEDGEEVDVHMYRSMVGSLMYLTVFDGSYSLSLLSTNLVLAVLTSTSSNRTVKYPKGFAKNMLVGIGKFIFLVDFIILDMPEEVKVHLILRRPFLSITHAKIDVFKRKITLKVRDEKIIFQSVKPASSLIKRVYMLSLREKVKLNLKARLMGETFIGKYDGYRHQDMEDIFLGKRFCKASCIEARRFDGLIPIHNGSDNVTYQMA